MGAVVRSSVLKAYGGDGEAEQHDRGGEPGPDGSAPESHVVDGGGGDVAVKAARKDGALDQVGDDKVHEERDGAGARDRAWRHGVDE